METISLQIALDFPNPHDKYKFIFADDTEELRNYRKQVMERGMIVNAKTAIDTIENALVKASNGKLTRTND